MTEQKYEEISYSSAVQCPICLQWRLAIEQLAEGRKPKFMSRNFFLLATARALWDFNSPTSDWTSALGSESAES